MFDWKLCQSKIWNKDGFIKNNKWKRKLQRIISKIWRKLYIIYLIQGHGAFGKVYQATFTKNGKDYALKRISKK